MKHFRLTFLIVFALAIQSLTVKATNVVDIIVNSEEHTILETALIEANLVDDLQGAGPFTVFAPTDDAFDALPEGTLDALLDDIVVLTDFLLYHVLPGTVMSTDLSDGITVEMYNGNKVEVSITGAGVFINNAKVTIADIETENGVVHVLDAVLVPAPDVQLKETAEYGQILTDTYGNTLYFFSKDAEGNSMCVDGCVTNWPVFYSETPELGEGLSETDFASFERADGSMQTTYKGWPLYYFVNDTIPGETNGEGLIGKWFVAKPDYTIMLLDDQLTGNDGLDYKSDYTSGEEITQYFVDEKGNTLYTWVNDNYGINNFTDADFEKNSIWPVYEEENIVVPSVLDSADFGVINVYGKKQMTFKGWPLYYFGQDMMMRGSNKGVSVPSPGVWPVAVEDLEMAPIAETVVDIAISDDNFSILVAALTREDLTIDFVSALTGEGPFTVFAPTNAAFAALLDELGASSLGDIDTETLEAVLQMHVLAGNVMSADLSEGLAAETLLGQELTFSLEGGATLTDPNGRVSNITAVDIEAQNGVVHVIDTVILPDLRPETVVDIATSDDNFSILVAALTREDLTIDFVSALTGEGPFTVFAPT
ncbi:MAG: fasciclin domain-containing protein, partial [Bacteroidota bacterium]